MTVIDRIPGRYVNVHYNAGIKSRQARKKGRKSAIPEAVKDNRLVRRLSESIAVNLT